MAEKKQLKTKKTEVAKIESKPRGKLTKNIKPGVTVMVTKGKNKGKIGEIVEINRKLNMVFFKDINQVLDYKKGSTDKIYKAVGVEISKIKLVNKENGD